MDDENNINTKMTQELADEIFRTALERADAPFDIVVPVSVFGWASMNVIPYDFFRNCKIVTSPPQAPGTRVVIAAGAKIGMPDPA